MPMLWVYDHYKYVHSYSAGIDLVYRRQILTTKVFPRAVRVKRGRISSIVCTLTYGQKEIIARH